MEKDFLNRRTMQSSLISGNVLRGAGDGKFLDYFNIMRATQFAVGGFQIQILVLLYMRIMHILSHFHSESLCTGDNM